MLFTQSRPERAAVNTYVAYAVPIPDQGAPEHPEGAPPLISPQVRAAALPEGFPFLVDGDTGEVIEPVLMFLCSKHLARGRRRWPRNTAQGQAEALKDFWRYLDAAQVAWRDVDEGDLTDYREAMLGMVSRKTREFLSDQTVRLRLTHVLSFYDWARNEGVYTGAQFSKREVRRIRPLDEDASAHTRGAPPTTERAAVLDGLDHAPGDPVQPFRRSDLQRVLRALGPLPSEREADGTIVDPRPSRDRLAAEMGVELGMRVDEVARLKAFVIQDLCPSDWKNHDLGHAVILHLTETKGLKPRRVPLPVWLLKELDLYIRGERAAAVEKAAGLRSGRRGKPASALFVNGSSARANVGKDVTRKTIQAAFHLAVMDAGLVRRAVKTDPDTREQRREPEAKHSFHDLRHTFAVWTYLEERKRGNAEPWKQVQALLGHKNLATTLKHYLKIVPAEEAAISDSLWSHSRSIAAVEDA